MNAQAEAAWRGLPVEIRRQLLKCREAYQAFRIMDTQTDLSEDAKCEIGRCFPIAAQQEVT
jgi:hypothetical protein